MGSSRTISAILRVAAVSVTLGCSAKTPYPTAHLAGAVSIDGAQVNDGKIVFLPRDKGHGPVVGVDIRDGRYDCPSAPTGNLIVQIHALRDTGKKLQVMGKQIPELISIVPNQARDGLETNVLGDNLALDFLLTNKP